MFTKSLFWILINMFGRLGMKYNGLGLLLDGREKLQTRLRTKSQTRFSFFYKIHVAQSGSDPDFPEIRSTSEVCISELNRS